MKTDDFDHTTKQKQIDSRDLYNFFEIACEFRVPKVYTQNSRLHAVSSQSFCKFEPKKSGNSEEHDIRSDHRKMITVNKEQLRALLQSVRELESAGKPVEVINYEEHHFKCLNIDGLKRLLQTNRAVLEFADPSILDSSTDLISGIVVNLTPVLC